MASTSDRLDTWLSIVQRIAVVLGLLGSAWFFFLREESSPYVRLEVTPRMNSDCIVYAEVSIENLGGRVWTIDSITIAVYQPNMRGVINDEQHPRQAIARQVLDTVGALRIKEKTAIVLSVKPEEQAKYGVFVIQVSLKIAEEEPPSARIQEAFLEATDGC